jgi:FkbM family methyltransferase
MRIARVSELLTRGAKFLSMLPEHCANSLRFRVFFVREGGFRTPLQIRVAARDVDLLLPDEEGVREDCMDCLFHNCYGLGHQLGQVRTILDIGANVGFFALAARSHYPHAIIHAYEPNPRVLPLLHANTAGLDVRIYPEALGASPGSVVMNDRAASQAARTRPSQSGTGIPQITIGTAIERIGGSVDLLKLDCEGAEWEILAHGDSLNAVRSIRMEYHLFDGQSYAQILDVLLRARFRVVHVGNQYEVNGILWASRA